jgi:hypothetical protein
MPPYLSNQKNSTQRVRREGESIVCNDDVEAMCLQSRCDGGASQVSRDGEGDKDEPREDGEGDHEEGPTPQHICSVELCRSLAILSSFRVTHIYVRTKITSLPAKTRLLKIVELILIGEQYEPRLFSGSYAPSSTASSTIVFRANHKRCKQTVEEGTHGVSRKLDAGI